MGGGSEPPSMERPPQRLSRFRWRTSSWMSEVRAWWPWFEDASSMGTPCPWGHPILGLLVVSCPTGHLKLTDFGLSRHLQWGERAHTICGTLQYMGKGAIGGCDGGHSPPRHSSTHPHSPRGAERGALQPCSRLVVPGCPALRSGQRGGEDHGVGGIMGLHGVPLNPFLPPSSPWHRPGTMWPCWSESSRAATRAHPRSAPRWPG